MLRFYCNSIMCVCVCVCEGMRTGCADQVGDWLHQRSHV